MYYFTHLQTVSRITKYIYFFFIQRIAVTYQNNLNVNAAILTPHKCVIVAVDMPLGHDYNRDYVAVIATAVTKE